MGRPRRSRGRVTVTEVLCCSPFENTKVSLEPFNFPLNCFRLTIVQIEAGHNFQNRIVSGSRVFVIPLALFRIGGIQSHFSKDYGGVQIFAQKSKAGLIETCRQGLELLRAVASLPHERSVAFFVITIHTVLTVEA